MRSGLVVYQCEAGAPSGTDATRWIAAPDAETAERAAKRRRWSRPLPIFEGREFLYDDRGMRQMGVDVIARPRDPQQMLPNNCPECARSFGPHYSGACDH